MRAWRFSKRTRLFPVQMHTAPSTDFNSAYKTLRNRFRIYRPESVVRATMNFLQTPSRDTLHDLQKMPWHVLLLLKWVCQDSMTSDQTGKNITPQEFTQLRQELHDFPAKVDLGIRSTLPHRLLVRQLLRAQVEFQRPYTMGFAREAALLNQQPENSPLRRLFEQKTGITTQSFLDLALAAYTAILSGSTVLDASWFAPIRAAYTEPVVDAFIRVISRDYFQLRDFFRALPDRDPKRASEYYEFPVIKRYPFLRTGNTLECWHPMVFYRGIEGFIHSVLSEAGQDYIDHFSKLFESHVTSEAAKVDTLFLNEQQIASFMPANKEVPDSLLSFRSCNIFIESKAGLFDESVMVVGHSEMFARKTASFPKSCQPSLVSVY
jgi:hypothetical protein